MNKKIIISLLILSFSLSIILHQNYIKNEENIKTNENDKEDNLYSSNTILDINYVTKDEDGNEYIINAKIGEIDFSEPNIIYLTDVNALIKLNNSENIKISSNYGKYNSENLDTIFSKNVNIDYLDNKITSEYLDFSINRNSMIISKKVVYKNLDNILKADIVEINIKSKDTKIFRYEADKKVNIINNNFNGNN